MKIKNYIYFSLLIIFFIFFKSIISYDRNLLQSLFLNFVPALLPALILINLFIDNGGLETFYNLLWKTKIGRLFYTILLIILSCIIGLPSMQIIIMKLKEKNIIDETSAFNFINCIGCISFPFLSSVLLLNINNWKLLAFTFIAYFLINAIFLYFKGFKINQNIITQINYIDSPTKTIKKSIDTILIILSNIILFSIPNAILMNINSNYYYFTGIIEFSSAVNLLIKNINPLNLSIIMGLIYFPSLSIMIQCKLINKNLNLRALLKTRFIAATIIFISTYCYLI